MSMLGVLAYGEVEFWLALIKYGTPTQFTGNPDLLAE
jgi:amino acid permease